METERINVFHLTTQWAKKNGFPLSAHQETSSTNDLAKLEAFKLSEDFVLYLAEHQNHGRGRFDRTWTDGGHGDFFLSSWSYRVAKSPSPVVTARIGLSVVETFNDVFPNMEWSLKAPNDIFLKGQKVAGILTEAVTQGNLFRLIVGLGVNVHSSPNITQASSLKELGKTVTASEWNTFLTTLNDQLLKTTHLAHMSELQPPEQSRLLHWLNKNPTLTEHYSSVGKDGSLAYNEQVVPWNEI